MCSFESSIQFLTIYIGTMFCFWSSVYVLNSDVFPIFWKLIYRLPRTAILNGRGGEGGVWQGTRKAFKVTSYVIFHLQYLSYFFGKEFSYIVPACKNACKKLSSFAFSVSPRCKWAGKRHYWILFALQINPKPFPNKRTFFGAIAIICAWTCFNNIAEKRLAW
jgi:hypothetical protein